MSVSADMKKASSVYLEPFFVVELKILRAAFMKHLLPDKLPALVFTGLCIDDCGFNSFPSQGVRDPKER